MTGDEVTETVTMTLPDRWVPFGYSAPLLLKCLCPLATIAPELLDTQEVVDVILGIYLINMNNFRNPKAVPPLVTTERAVAVAWRTPRNFWHNNRDEALRYHRIDGKSKEVWPLMEIALRLIAPNLPPLLDPMADFKRADMQDPKIKELLHCIAVLLGVATRRTIRPKP